jgi:holliday junction DNA helicase RuvA
MFEYIKGKLVEKSPAHCVVDVTGLAYFINISVITSSDLKEENAKVYLHLQVREDAHVLYGFSTYEEREVFRKLISVSGVGASTARLILSGMTSEEVVQAILGEDIGRFKSVKGIGAKSAQRIIVDLKDKLSKEGLELKKSVISDNTSRDEALSALIALGFVKLSVNKALDKVLVNSPDANTEELVKQALKVL